MKDKHRLEQQLLLMASVFDQLGGNDLPFHQHPRQVVIQYAPNKGGMTLDFPYQPRAPQNDERTRGYPVVGSLGNDAPIDPLHQ